MSPLVLALALSAQTSPSAAPLAAPVAGPANRVLLGFPTPGTAPWDPGPGFFVDPATSFGSVTVFSRDGLEEVGVMVPANPIPNAPLVVHFHAAQGSPAELTAPWAPSEARDFLLECEARGWYLISPSQGVASHNGSTYGNARARERVERAIHWAVHTFDIDEDRLFGFGFSMGGGDLLSFAAHMRDPNGLRFAALAVNDPTASVEVEWDYASTLPTNARLTEIQRAMGDPLTATPVAVPRVYHRCSALSAYIDPVTGVELHPLDPQPLWNLIGVPLHHVYSSPSAPGTGAAQRFSELGSEIVQISGAAHTVALSQPHQWENFDTQRVYQEWDAIFGPSASTTTAYWMLEGRRYDDLVCRTIDPTRMGLVQRTASLAIVGPDLVTLNAAENVARLDFDATPYALLPNGSRDLRVTLHNAALPPQGSTLFVIDNVLLPSSDPSVVTVTRNGVPAPHGARWRYDPAQGTLYLSMNVANATDVWDFDML